MGAYAFYLMGNAQASEWSGGPEHAHGYAKPCRREVHHDTSSAPFVATLSCMFYCNVVWWIGRGVVMLCLLALDFSGRIIVINTGVEVSCARPYLDMVIVEYPYPELIAIELNVDSSVNFFQVS
jgi:hypothetical protein